MEPIRILVDKGLVNATNVLNSPAGSLELVTDMVYEVGCPALFTAKGRTSRTMGTDTVTQMVAVTWDEAISGTPGAERYCEAIVKLGSGVFTTVDLPASATAALSKNVPTCMDTGLSIGSEPFEAVCFRNKWVLFHGGVPTVLHRTAGSAEYSMRMGLPSQTIKPSVYQSTGHALPEPGKLHGMAYAWFVWYDAQTGRESSTVATAVGEWAQDAENPTDAPDTISEGDILIYTPKAALDSARANVPISDTYLAVRVYVACIVGPTSEPSPHGPNQWPVGGMVYQVLFKDLPYDTCNIAHGSPGGLPTAVPADTYYFLSGHVGSSPNYWPVQGLTLAYFYAIAGGSYPFFPSVSVVNNGIRVGGSRAGVAPLATTGTTFMGSIVMNDVLKPYRYWWTWPESIHQVPEFFYGDIDTDLQDVIYKIRNIRGRCLMVAKKGVYRLNYLPSAADVNFQQGTVLEEISTDGAVGKQAVIKITPPTGGSYLVWMSWNGMRASNGFEVLDWSPQIKWASFFTSLAFMSTIRLVDDPTNQRFLLYYSTSGGTPTQALAFHYGRMIEIDGKTCPAVTGPLKRSKGVVAATLAMFDGGEVKPLTVSAAGALLRENEGYTDAGDALVVAVGTTAVYLAEKGRQFQVSRLGVDLQEVMGGAITYTPSLKYGTEASLGPTVDAGLSAKSVLGNVSQGLFKLFSAQGVAEWVQAGMSLAVGGAFGLYGFTVSAEAFDEAARRSST